MKPIRACWYAMWIFIALAVGSMAIGASAVSVWGCVVCAHVWAVGATIHARLEVTR